MKFLLEMYNRSTNAVLEAVKGQFMFPGESLEGCIGLNFGASSVKWIKRLLGETKTKKVHRPSGNGYCRCRMLLSVSG